MTRQLEVQNNWKTKFIIAGTAIGALVGFGTAYLMAKTAEDRTGGPPQVKPTDLLKVGVNVISVVRGIAALADR